MANQLNENKEKITYAEWNDVRMEIRQAAAKLTLQSGVEVSEAEMLRRITLEYANKRRKAQGRKIINRDPRSFPEESNRERNHPIIRKAARTKAALAERHRKRA